MLIRGAKMDMTTDINQMPVLTRRRIEAMVLEPMIRAFAEEMGKEKAYAIARRVITKIAQEQGRELAQRAGGKGLREFVGNRGPWTASGALETEMVEASESKLSYNITRCKYAEMYKEMGIEELGAIFSCGRDWAMSQGFNPKIKLTRTQTIMEGASHCDFRYTLAKEEKRGG